MKLNLFLSVAIVSLFTLPSEAHGAYEFQLFCPGRDPMTVTYAGYGLVTLLWNDSFYVGTNPTPFTMKSSVKAEMLRFQNGDRLFRTNRGEAFFQFKGEKDITACQTGRERTKPVRL